MTRMVEKRASTVEDATAAALHELGVDRTEADVEVISEGRRGLFGGRSRAHVRVTARDLQQGSNGEAPVADTAVDEQVDEETERTLPPVEPADDAETVEATPPGDGQAPTADAVPPAEGSDRLAELNEEADLAADFVEGLLDILELPGDIEIEVDESQAFVNVVEVGSGLLIGRRGATLDALQELVRAATQRQIERRSHVRIDIEGYRQRQLEKIKDRCRDGIAQVRETGEPYRLEPMDAYERKVMHDLVARTGGVRSASEGVEPRRRVVVYADNE
jgi:spoIIIJ-associated protein